ncbi:putative iron-regulated protein [Azospirillum fermentarium]|uniref:ChaN family lipoprotein n=1 Tax=Azospirillum fermentarium TaxID=1233114 RepID=UPI002226639D|nr:ChaN family lipoprotein [Azospirillum fermentarium]MCW2244558.1 putative iron-regulated protein [Azospirillum fermentarium]
METFPLAPHRTVVTALTAALLGATLLAGCTVATASDTGAETACAAPGRWYDGAGQPVDQNAVLSRAASAPAVLLGERHDSAEQHRWQLQTLAALHAVNPNLAVGLEMMPRSRQPVLDRWVAGAMDEAAFLKESGWTEVWGFDAAFYLPVLHFARMHRLPLVALNVNRALVSRTAKEGWDAIPADAREGVGDPAPLPAAYIGELAEVMSHHGAAVDRGSPRFQRFTQAQALWDRAMAESIATAHRRTGRTVVALAGSGHLRYGHGIPHQLAALGIGGTQVLLPWETGQDCAELTGQGPRVADAVFGIAPDARSPAETPPRPRLGVNLEPADGAVRVAAVQDGSIAARAGVKPGDRITAAAGRPVTSPADLTALVQRQTPGTWLPITVQRGGKTQQIIAKFPAP